ncbi:MAG: copper resistance protein NlpE [Rickettsiales bacterium]|jgi:uncharacterized lipoprotein NlpE involved in copper resistance|nr:copper resistance protein NlpE [Rickettsiales bacterium]
MQKNKTNPARTGKYGWKPIIFLAVLIAGIEAAFHLTPCLRKQLDGTYSGTIPCADCGGIRETLELKDGNYILTLEYNGRKPATPVVAKGKYEVGKCGTIRLDAETGSVGNYRQAGKDALIHLDMDGQVIESEFNYVLRKQ